MMTMQSFRHASHNDLWIAAFEALLDARWVDARAALDALLEHHRHCAADRLPDLDALPVAPPSMYRPVLEDRLHLWNAAVDRPRPAREVELDLTELDDLD